MVGGDQYNPRQFVGHVVVEQQAKWWVLQKPLRYVDDDKQICVIVPEGFITDFASVPRVLWNLASPDDYEYSAAAVVHDRLYETHEKPRRLADGIFFDAMSIHGTPYWKRLLMWAAVRIGGHSAYLTGPSRQIERRRIDAANQKEKNHGSD